MTAAGIPRSVRLAVSLALVGLALTVPHSAPDGTGMQCKVAALLPVPAL